MKAVLQRQCACGGTPGRDGECAACKAKRLQRQARAAGPQVAPAVVHDVLRSSGRPLEPGVRGAMEARFGHDFSRVRVHTDARAAESARAVDAHAYTVGRDVVFDDGQYTPSSYEGRRLIAHELVHVVQQHEAAASGPLHVGSGTDAAEADAERLAGSERPPAIPPAQRIAVARQAPAAPACPDGNRDLWLTAFFRTRATKSTRARLRTEIDGAKRILKGCCLRLKVAFDWRLLPGSASFPAGASRPAGDKGGWDYPADAETLGEGKTFGSAKGVPMLVVGDVPGSGGGVTVTSAADTDYTGPTYFAISVLEPNENTACNTITHELWHVAGKLSHDAADGGGIAACTDDVVTPSYCAAIGSLVPERRRPIAHELVHAAERP